MQRIWGWLGRQQVEVTAAVDTAEDSSAVASTMAAPTPAWQDLQQDLAETKRMVETMTKRLAKVQAPIQYPAGVQSFYEHLARTGLKEEFLLQLMEETMQALSPESMQLPDSVWAQGEAVLARRLKEHIHRPAPRPERPRVVCLIGPTGVGKTTTVAKLAAGAVLQQQQRVALVTFDTYRIAAVDQLRTYGEILDAPVQVVLTPYEMQQALLELSGYDVIFVDSVGRSQKNKMQISELKAFLEATSAHDVYLTMSATTQYEIILDVAHSYRVAQPTALLFTKLDEATVYGPLVNLMLETGLPVAYMSNGQDVPTDIIEPQPVDLARLLLGEDQHA